MTRNFHPHLAAAQTLFRAGMAIHPNWIYLDHAAVAPLSIPAQQKLTDWAQEAATKGDTVWPQWAQQVEKTRQTAARLINAASTEIALIPNTTTGLGLVAEGYPWQAGDNVITLEHEFPSNRYPWMHLASRGVEVRTLAVEQGRVDLERILSAMDARTRIVAVSWVGYSSGYRIDVAQFAQQIHARGALLMLDAIQGMGVFPLDVKQTDVDFVAADGHKWMLGPEGAGIFYLKAEHLNLLRPLQVGWNSVARPYDFGSIDLTFRPAASRYEGGSQNMMGMIALGESLSLLEQVGCGPSHSAVGELVLQTSDYLVDRLLGIGGRLRFSRDADHRSGIITFDFPGQDPQALREQLLARHVVCSVRGGGLRFSPHGYHTQEELDSVVDILAELIA